MPWEKQKSRILSRLNLIPHAVVAIPVHFPSLRWDGSGMVFTGQCIAQRFAVLLGRGTQWEILPSVRIRSCCRDKVYLPA